MKLLWNAKDGGPESRVWCWGIESKRFGSVLLLKFGEGSREAYHTHAFNSISWLLRGFLTERHIPRQFVQYVEHYEPSLRPIRTYRETNHMVEGGAKASWVLSFRGPWADTWREWLPKTNRNVTLTHGRKEVIA